MYAGELVECAEVGPLFAAPRHPYTQGLLRSVLGGSTRREDLFSIPGGVPIAGQWPAGCRFHPRCPQAQAGLCDVQMPPLQTVGDGTSRCHFAQEARILQAWDATKGQRQEVAA
jgi:peptide/nickel transport system ATP-binding protein